MTVNGYDSYRDSEILSADPLQLVQILYCAAIDSITEAQRHLVAGAIRERSNAISTACEILSELTLSVDQERGGDIARNLIELYDYMQRRLIEANSRQSSKPLAEVETLLRTVLEGWRTCLASVSVPSTETRGPSLLVCSF
jgi:flagellar protein FliS